MEQQNKSHIGHPLQHLAKTLQQTNSEQSAEDYSFYADEEYILTPDEAEAAILNAIKQKKQHKAYKYVSLGMTEKLIEEKFATIDWEKEIDPKRVLQYANTNKHYQIWQIQQRENERNQKIRRLEDLKQTWTAKTFLRMLKVVSHETYHTPLILNNHTLSIIKPVCFFLSRDPRFETELGFSLKKGLMLRGRAGLGKTHVVRCLEENELNPIHVVSMLEVTEDVAKTGEYKIPEGFSKLYLDDVGSEVTPVKYYGTEINWFKEFMEMFYLRTKNKDFSRLMISTNFSASEFEAKYGYRVRSRFKDMFNVVDVDGEDLRGQ